MLHESCFLAIRPALGVCAAIILSLSSHSALAQQSSTINNASTENDDGLLGDDFARDTGAIIVTANRLGRGNLFETIDTPERSCLANAPAIGSAEPGFTIDASGMRRVRDLERVRRRTRAGTIYVSGGSFVGDDFRRARLYDMCFFRTDLSQTNWSGASANGLGFVDTDLTGANLSGTNFPFVLFRNTKLGLVNAQNANWSQGRIDGGWQGSLRELDLSNADLTGFEIVCGETAEDGCPTERGGINLSGATLRRTSFHSFYVSELNMADARVDQTELALDHLRFLEPARLVGPIVLRSPRRAIMLFPGEAQALAEVALAANSGTDSADICALADTPAVQLICQEPGTGPRALLQSTAEFEQAAQNTRGYSTRRAAWLANRDSCMQLGTAEQRSTCVTQAYQARQAELRSLTGSPDWVDAAGYRLFLSREAAYPTNRERPGLYGRILPILLDSAVAAVIVKSDGNGGLSAKGMSVDGCYFEANGLAYSTDSASLAFAERRRRRRSPVIKESLIGFEGNLAEIHDEGLVRAGSCGADNPFPQLEELVLDNELLTTIWERF